MICLTPTQIPILALLSCPLVMLTLGLFLLVINAFTFWLASWISQSWLNIGFHVDGYLPALIGSIIVSVVATVLYALWAGLFMAVSIAAPAGAFNLFRPSPAVTPGDPPDALDGRPRETYSFLR